MERYRHVESSSADTRDLVWSKRILFELHTTLARSVRNWQVSGVG
jgi:hypothetical protein